MVFDACSNGSGVIKSADVITYVRDNWVHKENDVKQVSHFRCVVVFNATNARSRIAIKKKIRTTVSVKMTYDPENP